MSDLTPERTQDPALAHSQPTSAADVAEEKGATPLRWLIAFSGAVVMVVGVFIPWFGADAALLEARGWFGAEVGGLTQVMGINTSWGAIAGLFGGIAAVGLLLQRNLVGALMAVAGLALSVYMLMVWIPAMGDQVTVLGGLYVNAAACVVTLVASLLASRALPVAARRRLIRRWINRKLNPGDEDSKGVDSFIITLIAINVLSVMVETEAEVADAAPTFFLINEAFSTFIFSVEYILRVWVSDTLPQLEGKPWKRRLRYSLSMMALVDLVAIAPFFMSFIEMDTRIARVIRLMRLFRILKMGRYAHAIRTLKQVIGRKKEELAIVTFVSVLVLILSASALYFIEHEAQPEAFRSIPQAMWWAVVTLTSVGYGDVSPVTGWGKVAGSIVCMVGVLLVALPTGILASGFLEEMREQRRGKDSEVFGFCPHCGKQLIPGEELE